MKEEASQTSGLYVGTGEPEPILTAVTRHSLNSDTILLVDPFYHPKWMRAEYSPLFHPDEHRVNALRAANIWLLLAPWIAVGIVKFIRIPRDFDSRIHHESLQIQRERYKRFPELEHIAKREAEKKTEKMDVHGEYWMLSHPDEYWAEQWQADHPDATQEEIARFVDAIHRKRENHPYYFDPLEKQPGQTQEFLFFTSGANYDMAKRTATLTGSHLITDLPSRWREIELDRQEAGIDSGRWSPFAKALHQAKISYLNNVPLEAALQLREEKRLEHMRSFMRKVWKASAAEPAFDDANTDNLAGELLHQIREAEAEWAKIDQDLMKWARFSGATALAGAVASGGAAWIPAAVAATVGGVTSLAVAQHQRRTFQNRFPAGFFLKLGTDS